MYAAETSWYFYFVWPIALRFVDQILSGAVFAQVQVKNHAKQSMLIVRVSPECR